MVTQTLTTTSTAPTLTPAERRALRALRARYHQDRDLFTPTEMARLRFLHWLAQTGRLMP